MSFPVIVAIIMFVAMVALILADKFHVSLVFVLVPTIAALVLGFSPKEIGNFAMDGFKSVANTATMMTFAILYFGILWKVGVFDLLIQKVLKLLGNSVLKVCFVTALLSNLTQLDGSGSTTAICTIPTLRPIYEKMKIRKEALMLIFSMMSGVWCLLPWTGGFLVACAATNVDIYECFRMGWPIMVIGALLAYLACIPIAAREKKNGAGLTDAEWNEYKASLARPVELKVSKGVVIFDIVWTLILLVGLMAGLMPATLAFMVFYAIAMIVNFPSTKQQGAYIREQASSILTLLSVVLALGVLLGVTKGTGMVNSVADLLASALPAGIAKHIVTLFCLITLPLACFIGSDNIKTVIAPALIAMVAPLGISAVQVVLALQIMIISSANLTLFTATPYFALGLADVSMKDHIKFSFLSLWAYSLVLLVITLLFGIIPL